MSSAIIYHNPECGTSRNTLALIRHAGIEPTIILYLEDPPSRDTIRKMITDAGLTVRQALREKGTPFGELELGNPELTMSNYWMLSTLIQFCLTVHYRESGLTRSDSRLIPADLLPCWLQQIFE